MKIKSVFLKNFAKVSKINVNFDPNLTYLVGDNGSGKTTIGLNGIFFVMKGLAQKGDGLIAERFRFVGPKGRSAKGELDIYDEKDDVTHIVTRKLTKDKTELTIESSDGIQRGQVFLDDLFSAILINPFRFSELSGKEQALLFGADTVPFDEQKRELVEKRRDIGREVKRLKTVYDEYGKMEEVIAVSVSTLLKERTEIVEYNEKIAEQQRELAHLDTMGITIFNEITALKEQLEVKEKALIHIQELREKIEDVPEPYSLTEIDNEILDAETINSQARKYQAGQKARYAYEAERKKYDIVEGSIKANEADRADFLHRQELPFSNISINDDGEFRFDGRPFNSTYFSTGERLKFGARLGTALLKNEDQLKYVWIPDAQQIDEQSREILFKELVDEGFQIAAEIVSEKKIEGTCSILLSESQVVEEISTETKGKIE